MREWLETPEGEAAAGVRYTLAELLDPRTPTDRRLQQLRKQQKVALVEIRKAFDELSPANDPEFVQLNKRLFAVECRDIEQDIRDIRREIVRAFNSLDDRALLSGPRGRRLVALMES